MEKTTEELWDMIYQFRREYINNNTCPDNDCRSFLNRCTLNGVHGYYICCGCNKIWVYYGAEIDIEKMGYPKVEVD